MKSTAALFLVSRSHSFLVAFSSLISFPFHLIPILLAVCNYFVFFFSRIFFSGIIISLPVMHLSFYTHSTHKKRFSRQFFGIAHLYGIYVVTNRQTTEWIECYLIVCETEANAREIISNDKAAENNANCSFFPCE